ncbi:MAG: DUF1330 domain-containing protein [Spongiibacteraceae bacterium]
MPAYIIVTREGPIRDQAAYDTYSKKNRENPRDPNLTPLVIYGAVEGLEGTAPDGVIVMKFPTMEDAKAWYNSPAYQASLPYRKQAADYRAFIVEGL